MPAYTPDHVSGGDLALVEEGTRRSGRERGAFRADQIELVGNIGANYYHTLSTEVRKK